MASAQLPTSRRSYEPAAPADAPLPTARHVPISPLSPLIALALIGFAGVAAQWTAWRLRLPSILLLLVVGLALGPGFDVIRPRELFGTALDPMISLAVAVILFEGGLTLKLRELGENAAVITRLLTVGVLVTWGLATAAAHFIAGLPMETALVLGAILTVTGPTVIGPLLRQIRPRGPSEAIAKWEGIVVDVVGATLAVLVLHAVVEGAGAEGARHTLSTAALDLGKTALVGTVIGVAGAWLLGFALRRHLVPDELESPLSLGFVLLAFAGADSLAHESGLLAVTLMGFLLANRRDLSVHHIVEFKENLRVLLISTLFIVLAATVEVDAMLSTGWRGVAFVAALILVVRPACVLASTIGTRLPHGDRAFLAMLAPRGIVAAAVSSLFAIRLQEVNVPGSELMAPLAFIVIIGTVAIYGLSAGPIARRLGISDPDAQGTLIAGAGPFARELERALRGQGIDVILVDSNRAAVRAASMDGARARRGSILSSRFLEGLQLGGTGRFIGLTANDEVNALAAAHFSSLYGRASVYQAATSEGSGDEIRKDLRGRVLLGDDHPLTSLDVQVQRGATIKATNLTEEFTLDDFAAEHGENSTPIGVLEDGRLALYSSDHTPEADAGMVYLALVREPDSN